MVGLIRDQKAVSEEFVFLFEISIKNKWKGQKIDGFPVALIPRKDAEGETRNTIMIDST